MFVLMCPMAPQAPHLSCKRRSINMSEVSRLYDVSLKKYIQGRRKTKSGSELLFWKNFYTPFSQKQLDKSENDTLKKIQGQPSGSVG